MKLAIIGMGIMGCRYAKMISDGLVKGIEITAVTRITPERKTALKDVFEQGAIIYQTADDLFEAVKQKQVAVDAVLIVTPHLSHAELAVKAMERGLHVLCDKPAGAYSRQARQMREAAAKHEGIFFGMMFNQRMNPKYQRIREIVQSGMYGKMKRVSWTITDWYRPDGYYASGAWRGTWTGEASAINRLEISMEDALLVFENGKLRVRELKVHEPDYRKTATDYFAQPEGEWKEISCEGEDLEHVGILQNFADVVDGKAELFVEGTEGSKSLMFANAMYLSSWTGQMVKIPQNIEEELAFEAAYEEKFAKKVRN